jgi:hypothetical protein
LASRRVCTPRTFSRWAPSPPSPPPPRALTAPLARAPAAQTVVNPVTCKESPYHDQVYQKIADLKSGYQRFVPWLPVSSAPRRRSARASDAP